jgi:hypothetical protein
VANQTNLSLSSSTSGIFGVGVNGTVLDTPFSRWFSQHPSATNFTFGMALNPPLQNSIDAGVLHWTALDPSAYTGDISFVDTILPTSSDSPSAWFVQMDNWTFQSVEGQTSRGPCMTIVDPIYPNISLPQDWANEIR